MSLLFDKIFNFYHSCFLFRKLWGSALGFRSSHFLYAQWTWDELIKKDQALFVNLSMAVSQRPLKQLCRLPSNHCFINLSLEIDSTSHQLSGMQCTRCWWTARCKACYTKPCFSTKSAGFRFYRCFDVPELSPNRFPCTVYVVAIKVVFAGGPEIDGYWINSMSFGIKPCFLFYKCMKLFPFTANQHRPTLIRMCRNYTEPLCAKICSLPQSIRTHSHKLNGNFH